MKTRSLESIAGLVRREGIPTRPSIGVALGEVRSDIAIGCPPLLGSAPGFALGSIVVEWEFCLPLAEIEEFHKFLTGNEKFIADSVAKVIKGAHYRGTYYMLLQSGGCFRTLWSYDNCEALEKGWDAALKDPKSNFYKAMRQLRAFWLRDPNAKECRYAPAQSLRQLVAGNQRHAFTALTIDAAKLNRGGARKRG